MTNWRAWRHIIKVHSRILLVLILLVIVALLAVTDTMRRWYQSIDDRLSSDAKGILARRDDVFGQALRQPLETLHLLAASRTLAQAGSADIQADLDSWKANLRDVGAIYLIMLDGRSMASGGYDATPAYIQDAYRDYRERGAPALATPRVVMEGDRPLVILGAPLSGQSAGVVLATFYLDQMLGPLLVRLPGNNARLILLDARDQVLVDGFAQPAIGDPLRNGQRAAHPAALLAALQGKATAAGVVDGLYVVHGEPYRYYASRMSSTDWLLAYIQPEADLLAVYREARSFGWAQLFFVVLAALLLVAMMYRLVLRPLQALARVQEAMQGGTLPTPVAVRGGGEFAAMAASYNRLVADLAASELRLRTIFETFPETVVVTRLTDGVFLDANAAFLEKIGRSREEVIGHSSAEFGWVPEETESAAHRDALLQDRHLERRLIKLKTPQGEEFWSMYSSRLIEFDGVPAALSVSVDVTPLKLAETQVHQSEAKFAALFQLAPVPMSYTPEHDRFGHTHWNDAWYGAFGFLPEEAEGRGGDVLGIWVNPDERRRMIQSVLDTGHAHALQVLLRRKDGALRQHILYADRVETGEGKAMIVAYVDVTDSRRVEAELRASEETRHAVFNASPVAMLVSDMAHDYAVVDANQAWLRQFQRTLPEVVGRNGRQIDFWVNEDDRQRVVDQIERDGQVANYEAEFVRGDGSRLMCRVGARRVRVEGRELLLMLQEDITLQRQNELARQEAERKLRRFSFMVSHANDAMFLFDNGKIADCNEATLRMFRSTRERFIGQLPDAFSPPTQPNGMDSLELALDRVQAAIGGEPQRFEWVHTRGDGSSFDAEVSLSAFEESGRPLMIGVVRDITERKRAEAEIRELNATLEARVVSRTQELAQANTELQATLGNLQRAQNELLRAEKLASLGALVAGIAHELNTPIGNAVTVSSTLLDEQRRFSEKMASGLTRSALDRFVGVVGEAGQIVERNLYRAAELIGSFKQLAVDQSSYQRRPFDLQDVVHEIMLAMAPSTRRTPFRIIEEVPAGLVLDSYPGPLGQILMNLINNALIHAFDGRDSGHVWIRAEAAEPGWITLRVVDDGCGISAENQKRIFDPFFTTRLGQGGSGLGLHVVFSLVVDLLGGRIDVDSSPGLGAIFIVRLPVVAPQPKAKPAGKEEEGE